MARHQVKLWAFAVTGSLAAATTGAGALALGYLLREGRVMCGSGLCDDTRPYLALLPFAAAARGAIYLTRRPWSRRRPRGYFDEVAEAITDALRGSVAIIVFTFLFRSGFEFRDFSYSRLVFVYDWLLATAGLVILAVVTKAALVRLRERGHNQRNVVVIGSAEASAAVFQELVVRHPELGYQVLGEIPAKASGAQRSHFQSELLRYGQTSRIDEVILAVPRLDRRELSQLVGLAELTRVEIKAIPELFGLPPTKIALQSLGVIPALSLLREPLPGGRRVVKRAMDVALSVALLIVTGPIILMAAAAVRVTSNGPVLHRQERIGMDGRPFRMLKFRTMDADAAPTAHEEYVSRLILAKEDKTVSGGMFKLTDDPRVTTVGRILRRFSLDELPQLINVFRGEMSLVGPRPALAFEIALYEDWHRRRLDVRPGMTGLWQVSGRARVGFQEMVRLDVQYIERWSPLRDVLILCRTLPALFRNETG